MRPHPHHGHAGALSAYPWLQFSQMEITPKIRQYASDHPTILHPSTNHMYNPSSRPLGSSVVRLLVVKVHVG